MKRTLLSLMVLSFILFLVIGMAQAQKVVKWGALIDLSGPTSDWGKQQAAGQIDAARWINDTGGINGKEFKLIVMDDAYGIDKAMGYYKTLKDVEQVPGLYIQSTGTALSLKELVTRDKMPMFGASFTTKLMDPSKTPYNFIVTTTYEDMSRIALKWIKDNWKDQTRKPKVVHIYPDNPYGRAHLKPAKMYAEEIGIETGPDQVVHWPTADAKSQMITMKEYNPDFAYITSTAMNAAVILKDAKEVGVKSRFVVNIRSLDENLPLLGGEATEGVHGVTTVVPYGVKDIPFMKTMMEYHEKYRKAEKPTLVYCEGWANILTITEVLKRADKKGELSSEAVKAEFENLKDFDPKGIVPPITITSKDHAPATKAKIYQIQKGKLVPVSGWIDIGRDPKYFGI